MLFSVVKKRDAITDCERNDRASLMTRPHVPMNRFIVAPILRDESCICAPMADALQTQSFEVIYCIQQHRVVVTMK